ncbi:MAG: hypothetical protein ACTIAH_00135 [Leuconostoc mesenteroides]
MAEQKQNNANIFLKLFIALMFFIGFLVFMYPFIANGVNNYVAQKELNAVNQLNQSNQKASAKKLEKLIKKNKQKSKKINNLVYHLSRISWGKRWRMYPRRVESTIKSTR